MGESGRLRLDEALVAAGLAPSRARARDMVLRGTVSVDGFAEVKPARKVTRDQDLCVADPAAPYVSRAALKLLAGLDAFGFNPAGVTALDLGAAAGGFTQVLLERGARHVIALDVGHGQMDPKLARDPRVTSLEGVNARDLAPEHLGGRQVEAIVSDLSFISLKLALPRALALAEPQAWTVLLVKPQFEAGRAAIGKGGVVRDPAIARHAADGIAAWLAETQGWSVTGLLPSPIAGGDGNQEFLLGASRG